MKLKLAIGGLIVALGLTGVVWGDPEPKRPAALPTGEQARQVEALLQQMGQHWLAVANLGQRMRQIANLLTPEQRAAARQIRITPNQAVALVDLMQTAAGQALLNPDSRNGMKMAELLLPRALEILGPEQLDLILQLNPTPEQRRQIQTILAETAQTLKQFPLTDLDTGIGSLATPDQKVWLDRLRSIMHR